MIETIVAFCPLEKKPREFEYLGMQESKVREPFALYNCRSCEGTFGIEYIMELTQERGTQSNE